MKCLGLIIYFTFSLFSLYKFVTADKIIEKYDEITIVEKDNNTENNTHDPTASIGYWSKYHINDRSKFIYY
jgi:hypothetical protein